MEIFFIEFLLLTVRPAILFEMVREGKAFDVAWQKSKPRGRAVKLHLRIEKCCLLKHDHHPAPAGMKKFVCVEECGFCVLVNLATGAVVGAPQTGEQRCKSNYFADICELGDLGRIDLSRWEWLNALRAHSNLPAVPQASVVADRPWDEDEGLAVDLPGLGEPVVEMAGAGMVAAEVMVEAVAGVHAQVEELSEEESEEVENSGAEEDLGSEDETGGEAELVVGGAEGGLVDDAPAAEDPLVEEVNPQAVELEHHLEAADQSLESVAGDNNNNDSIVLSPRQNISAPSSESSSPSTAQSSADSSLVSEPRPLIRQFGAAFHLPTPGSYNATPVLFSSGAASAVSTESDAVSATNSSSASSSEGRRSAPILMASLSHADSTQSELISRENSELEISDDQEMPALEIIEMSENPEQNGPQKPCLFREELDLFEQSLQLKLQAKITELESEHNVTKQTLAAVQTTLKTTSDELATTKQSLTTSQNSETELRGLLEQKGDECEQLKRDKTTVETQLGDERREGETKGREVTRLGNELELEKGKVAARDTTISELEKSNEAIKSQFRGVRKNYAEMALKEHGSQQWIAALVQNWPANIPLPADPRMDFASPAAKPPGGFAAKKQNDEPEDDLHP